VEYRIYHVQSLLKAGAHSEANRAAATIDFPQFAQRLLMLKATTAFEQDDFSACRNFLKDCLPDDPQTNIAFAALSFKEGRIEEARDLYMRAMSTSAFKPSVACALALCHFRLHENEEAVRLCDEILEKAMHGSSDIYPKNIVHVESDMALDGKNRRLLEDSYVIETNNLRAAFEYEEKQWSNAKEFLTARMPPRREEDLDATTLHNQALIFLDEDATTSFRKLNFLLSNPPFPPEAFRNLLILQCQYGLFDLAAQTLSDNVHLTEKILSQDMVDYFGASIMSESNPEESFERFESQIRRQGEQLRKLSKGLPLSNMSGEKERRMAKIIERTYKQELEQYLALVMGQAKLIWHKGNYEMLERMFRSKVDILGDHEVWRLNMAHILFMQGGSKYKEAISLYEPIVENSKDKGKNASLLNVTPIVLANLCVSYIMTNQNEAAERIMKSVDKEEQRLFENTISQKSDDEENLQNILLFHSCIINLVIGTLYCERGNFEFGISRICKSLEPISQKLSPDTWFYSKRCFLALAEQLSKHMVTISDNTIAAIFDFFDEVEHHGKNLASCGTTVHRNTISTANHYDKHTTSRTGAYPEYTSDPSRTISYEARQLKYIYLKLRG
jgi:tetratricopeptide repeat protein 30